MSDTSKAPHAGEDSEALETLVAASPVGAELSPAQCAKLARHMTLRQLAPGELLFREGESDEALHVVLKGALEVVKNAGPGQLASLAVLRPGDLAGEMSFVDGTEHQAGLRALTDAEVFSLGRAGFERLVPEDADLVYKVMRNIIRAVHVAMRRMNLQHIELSNYIFKQHGRY